MTRHTTVPRDEPAAGKDDYFTDVEHRVDRIRSLLPGYPHERVKLARLITHFQKLQNDVCNTLLKSHGLTYVGYNALMMLLGAENRTATPGELSRATGEKPTNMTRICDEFVSMGLITRVPSDHDRRSVQVLLSKKGERLLATCQPEIWRALDQVYSVFAPAELAQMTRLLRSSLEKLEAATDA